MKTARIGCMVLGIALLMFVIAPYASAQAIAGLWYKGTASFKGYDIGSSPTNILGKDKEKGKMYVNIVTGVEGYDVTTCLEDLNTDNLWHLTTSFIPDGDIYGIMDEGETMIWDFFSDSAMVLDVGGDGPYVLYPMFTVKIKSSSVSFKSFACAGYDNTPTSGFGLGACTVSFKSIDALKVPTGSTACIRPL